MDIPDRVASQRAYEAPWLERLGGRVEDGCVLEVGCGVGAGTESILTRFGAREVVAFDRDPALVEQARRRLALYGPDRLRLYVGDVCTIPEPDLSFDAVFDFAVLHHVDDWRRAVAEIHRVLRPGGRFFFEEITRQALDRWYDLAFQNQPVPERFSSETFVAELERRGFEVRPAVAEAMGGDFLIGVARRL